MIFDKGNYNANLIYTTIRVIVCGCVRTSGCGAEVEKEMFC